jgi:hypothetical protein
MARSALQRPDNRKEVQRPNVHILDRAEAGMAEHNQQQGTGKHPHKSSEDPRPHTETSEHRGQSHRSEDASGRSDSGGSGDLKGREYRDSDGEVHHHTTTYMEQHRGEHASSGGTEKRHASSEQGSSGENEGRRESKEENHRHQEEGSQKRIDERGQQHHKTAK